MVELYLREEGLMDDLADLDQKMMIFESARQRKRDELAKVQQKKHVLLKSMTTEEAFDLGRTIERAEGQKRRKVA